MERSDLQELVEQGMTVREIAAATGKSYSTVRYWLEKVGLETTSRGPGRSLQFVDGRHLCRKHGAVRVTQREVRCAKCLSERVSARRRRVKEMLIEEAGGRCAICGYDRFAGALQFHHLDPAAKSFALSLRGLSRSLAALREEAAKCVLLCANCHAEVEWDPKLIGVSPDKVAGGN